ncbi:MAG: histidine kinase [Saprospiraceae bacterium]|nr:MAG: histidine kinase [Saprospiraceae bacterium]
MKKLWGILLFGFVAIISLAQSPQPFFRNFTTDHGLPSPEVYEIIQDSKGFIWFGTDNGVSRFNGYEFENFGFEDGLLNNVVFYLKEDEAGRIWMGTMSGNLYYHEKDSIFPFPFNDVIEQFREQFHSTNGILVKKDTVYLGLSGMGVIAIYPDGTYNFPLNKQAECLQTVKSNTDLLLCYQKAVNKTSVTPNDWAWNFYSDEFQFETKIPSFSLAFSGGNFFGVELANHYLLNTKGQFLLIQKNNKSVQWQSAISNNVSELSMGPDGEIFVGYTEKKGAEIYPDLTAFTERRPLVLLAGNSITDIMKDRAGGYWFSTLEQGVFYCSNFSYRVYNEQSGLTNANIRALAVKDSESFYVAADDGSVYKMNTKNQSALIHLPGIDEPEINEMVYSPHFDRLWIGGIRIRYLEDGHWKYVLDRNVFDKRAAASKRLVLSRDGNSIWGCYAQGFMKIDARSSEIQYRSSEDDLKQRTLTFYEDNDHHNWIGNVSGIYEFKNNQLTSPGVDYALFSIRVEDINQMQDSTLVLGTKGGGIVLWKNESRIVINEEGGLTSNMIECLFIDQKQNIWVGTLNGLNKISYDPLMGNFKVENFTMAHGLPSNEINDVCVVGEDVWVATPRGLVQLGKSPSQQNEPQPLLKAVWVNNHSVNLDQQHVFNYYENNFQFHFLTLNYKLAGRINYRYRLEESEKWNYTTNTSVNFPRLSPGEYAFEIQAQNEDGRWGIPLLLEFRILSPYWYNWIFWLGLVLILLFLMVWLYRKRILQLKHEAAIEREMNLLKQSALQAQMNPHFVFNCLNAIQEFIASDEKTKAAHYLSRFAQLVRATLHLSMEPLISLEEEVGILENYLELEKIRFKNRFDYHIKIAAEIQAFETMIPPLLLQPYIENAIIHGLVEKEKVGLIDIDYSQEGNCLLMEVRDNGLGIFHSQRNKQNTAPLHKSVGMSISRKRLTLLSNKNHPGSIHIKELKDQDGKVMGTLVRLRLDLNQIMDL